MGEDPPDLHLNAGHISLRGRPLQCQGVNVKGSTRILERCACYCTMNLRGGTRSPLHPRHDAPDADKKFQSENQREGKYEHQDGRREKRR